MARAFVWATLVAGTLDILYAAIMSSIFGKGPAAMLRTVASGPLPGATEMGAAGSILGLIVHFSLMAVMVAVFLVAARNWPKLLADPILAAIKVTLEKLSERKPAAQQDALAKAATRKPAIGRKKKA